MLEPQTLWLRMPFRMGDSDLPFPFAARLLGFLLGAVLILLSIDAASPDTLEGIPLGWDCIRRSFRRSAG
jgi:hypothetical protein